MGEKTVRANPLLSAHLSSGNLPTSFSNERVQRIKFIWINMRPRYFVPFFFVYWFFWRIQFTSDWSLFFMLDFSVWFKELRMWICYKWKIALAIKNVPNEVSHTVSFILFILFSMKIARKKAFYIFTHTHTFSKMNIQSFRWRMIGIHIITTSKSFIFFFLPWNRCMYTQFRCGDYLRGMVFFYFHSISSQNNEVNENRKG